MNIAAIAAAVFQEPRMTKTTDIEERLILLQKWSRAQLLVEWERLHRCPPPKCTSPQFMTRVISWRWQEEVYGGLSKKTEKLLDSLIRQYKSDPKNFVPQRTQIKSGTRLQRIWKGELHEVEATSDGQFNYRGQVYASLSKIARLITGAQWNGHVFFGLRKGKNAEAA